MTEGLFSLREREIFRTLKGLKDCEFAIIGGYAVNAYTLPRFSVDCDIVIENERELRKIEALLEKSGYSRKRLPHAEHYASFARHEKKLAGNFRVSIDMLIGKVVDRMTGAEFAASWIFENSKTRALKGKTLTEELKARVISMDALLAMKMTSCRATDIRDVFMMLPQAEDKEWIKKEIASRCDIKDRIARITEKIMSKEFKNGLSGVYGVIDEKTFNKHRKAIASFV